MSENFTEINMSAIPITIAEGLNIDLWAGKLICSAIAILIILMPITMIVKSRHSSWIPEVAITLLIMGFCMGLGWLDAWIFIVFCMLIGLMFALKMRKVIAGGNNE